jgi:PncC family amidohydrolase
MSFKIHFLKTFPSEAQVTELFKLFTILNWDIEKIEISQGSIKDFLGLPEDIVLITPEIREPEIFFNEGRLNIYLPIDTGKWNEVENFLEKRLKILRISHPEAYKLLNNIPEKDSIRVFISETGADFVAHGKVPEGIKEQFGEFIYSETLSSLEEVVGELLKEKALTLATAESCTGGMVASHIVNVSGSSEYFKGSVVAYSNEVKMKLLGVKEETLKRFGAVSEQTAIEMAEGVRKLLNTDIGISTTGIAGPTGGTPEKPVGLTYFGISHGDRTEFFKYIFPYDRNQNRLSATYFLLFKLYKLLREI